MLRRLAGGGAGWAGRGARRLASSGAPAPAAPSSRAGAAPPSTTTTIRLSRLGAGVTEAKLKAALTAAKVDSRRVLLEPGCALMVRNEAEAEVAALRIAGKFAGSHCAVRPTTMPALLLQNLPDSASAQSLEAAFSAQGPKSVQVVGGASVQVTIKSAESALLASSIIEKLLDAQLKTRLTKLPSPDSSDSYLLEVTNVPSSTDLAKLSSQLKEALAAASQSPISIKTTSAPASTATIRYSSSLSAAQVEAAVTAGLKGAAGSGVEVIGIRRIKKPCLSIRRVADHELLNALLFQTGKKSASSTPTGAGSGRARIPALATDI